MKHLISFVLRKFPRSFLQKVSHFVLRIVSLFYRGHNVYCPISNRWYRKFLPYGRGKSARKNALCPDSLSLERHRLIWLYLQNETDFFTAQHKVLHIAPELCFINKFKALPNLEYITADLESPLAQVKMDIHDIPFTANMFNIVFCNHVMEHVEDDIKALKEIHRVLKPGGWAIIQSPIEESYESTYEDPSITTPAAREKAFGQNDHFRMYGRDYAQRLEQGGFKVEAVPYADQFSKADQQKYGLIPGEAIYVCHKQTNASAS